MLIFLDSPHTEGGITDALVGADYLVRSRYKSGIWYASFYATRDPAKSRVRELLRLELAKARDPQDIGIRAKVVVVTMSRIDRRAAMLLINGQPHGSQNLFLCHLHLHSLPKSFKLSQATSACGRRKIAEFPMCCIASSKC